MRALPLLLLVALLPAVELATRVVRVSDGDTLTVAAVDGLPAGAKRGFDGDVYVRLLCVDTYEIWDEQHPPAPEGLAARDALAALCPPGTAIVLFDDAATLTADRYGRVLAFVRIGRTTAQEHLVAVGWSVYWRRWRDAPKALHQRLLEAEAGARAKTLGAWATQAADMVRKAAKRPR